MADLKIQITADDKASGTLKGLDGQVEKTGGGMGKLAGAAAVGAAAVVALGVKSVMAFEDLGLSVGKMADATGLTTEQASRLTEVAGDLGISQETISGSIGKMSKALGANGDAFKAYGIEAVKAKDGTTDVNATFLGAVDAINKIEDPLKKAEASAKVFGKGYQQMSELLGESSSKIKADLAAVSDQKVFDDGKVKQARDMRDAFDSVKDAGEDLLLSIGSALAPVVTKLAPMLAKVVTEAKPLAEAIGKTLASALDALGPIIEALVPVIGLLAKGISALSEAAFGDGTHKVQEYADTIASLGERAIAAGLSHKQFQQAIDETQGSIEELTKITEKAEATEKAITEGHREHETVLKQLSDTEEHHGIVAADTKDKVHDLAQAENAAATEAGRAQRNTDNLTASWNALTTALSDQSALLDVQDSFGSLHEKALLAYDAASKGAADSEQKQRDYQRALIDTKDKVIGYAREVGGLPPEVVSKIVADIDNGSIQTAEQALNRVARDRQVIYNAQATGHREYASGTSSAAPGLALVGENGPELVVMGGGERVIPAGQTAAMLGGGGGGDTINLYTGLDERRITALLRRNARRGGRNPWG